MIRPTPRGRVGGGPRVARGHTVWAALAVVGLMVLSLALRTTALGDGLWIDEGLSVGIAGHSLAELPGLLRQDGSPLLYYVLLHGWIELFGADEAAVRGLSLLAALAAVPVAFWAANGLFGRRAGLVAAGLAAVNPFLTAYAQEARMYTLVAFLSLVVAATFLQAFARGRHAHAVAFALALAALLHTHTWGLFLAAGTLAALAVIAPPARTVKTALAAYAGAALLYAAWIPTLLFQAAHTGAPWSSVPGPDKLIDGLLVPLGGGLVGVAALAPAAVWLARGRGRRDVAALVAMAGVTVCLAWIASQVEPNWANRYFAVALGPLLLALAAAAARLGAVGLAAAVALGIVWAADTGRVQRSNVRAVADAIPADERTLVIAAQPEQLPVLRHYTGAAPRFASTLGPAGDPAAMDWGDAVARLTRADPRTTLAATLSGLRPGDRVVLVRPVIAHPRNWRAPWTRLVRRRARAWRALLDDRLRPVRAISATPTGGTDVTARVYRVRAP